MPATGVDFAAESRALRTEIARTHTLVGRIGFSLVGALLVVEAVLLFVLTR
jgi:hypothetical protein